MMAGSHWKLSMLTKEPLAEAIRSLRRDCISVTAYIERLQSRSETIEPTIKSLVDENDRWDRLYQDAADLENRYPNPADRPPLYGVPIGIKDIFHATGFQTQAGSALPPDELTGSEAPAVTALREAGALVLGKTVTTEFAYFDPGPTRNPHDPAHTPGGSSSGSAAAVAAGLCPLAFGTQTVGSVIRPAAFCGIVGVKPSYGRVSTDGVIPLSTSVDHVGYFTQDVPGAAVAASLLCDEWRSLPHPREPPTLGVPDGPYLQQASDTALAAFETHLDRLTDAGYDVRRIGAFDTIEEINTRHERLVAADAALTHEGWFQKYREQYAEKTCDLIEEGLDVPVSEVAEARRSRRAVRETLERLLSDHGADLWIAPAAPGPAPEGIDSTGDPVMNLPWTHAGLPTIALPATSTESSLPLGVQCAAPFGADEDLLGWADDLSEALCTE